MLWQVSYTTDGSFPDEQIIEKNFAHGFMDNLYRLKLMNPTKNPCFTVLSTLGNRAVTSPPSSVFVRKHILLIIGVLHKNAPTYRYFISFIFKLKTTFLSSEWFSGFCPSSSPYSCAIIGMGTQVHPAGDVTRVSVMPRKVTVKIWDAENRCQ